MFLKFLIIFVSICNLSIASDATTDVDVETLPAFFESLECKKGDVDKAKAKGSECAKAAKELSTTDKDAADKLYNTSKELFFAYKKKCSCLFDITTCKGFKTCTNSDCDNDQAYERCKKKCNSDDSCENRCFNEHNTRCRATQDKCKKRTYDE